MARRSCRLFARAPRTRILVVSGLGEVHDPGADGFLAKPFTKSSLLSAVRRMLE